MNYSTLGNNIASILVYYGKMYRKCITELPEIYIYLIIFGDVYGLYPLFITIICYYLGKKLFKNQKFSYWLFKTIKCFYSTITISKKQPRKWYLNVAPCKFTYTYLKLILPYVLFMVVCKIYWQIIYLKFIYFFNFMYQSKKTE